VVAYKTPWLSNNIFVLEALNDHLAGIELICLLNLFFGETFHAGNLAIEVVSLGRAIARDCTASLSPCDSSCRVRVHDTANLIAPSFVENGMRGRIRGRPQRAFDHLAFQVTYDKILRGQLVIADT